VVTSVETSTGGVELGSGARRRPGVGTFAIIALFAASTSFKAPSGNLTASAAGVGSNMRSFKMSETPTVDGGVSVSVVASAAVPPQFSTS